MYFLIEQSLLKTLKILGYFFDFIINKISMYISFELWKASYYVENWIIKLKVEIVWKIQREYC